MTTKEIADSTGKAERTIQRWAKTTGVKVASIGVKVASVGKSGIPANYDLSETCQIIETGMGKNASNLFRMSAKEKPVDDSRLDRLENLMEKMLVAMGNMMLLQNPAQLKQLPDNTPKLSARDELRMLVNTASSESHDYAGTWKTLYQEVYYRLHINAPERARNSKTSAIDILESEGMLENAVLIAREIFKNG